MTEETEAGCYTNRNFESDNGPSNVFPIAGTVGNLGVNVMVQTDDFSRNGSIRKGKRRKRLTADKDKRRSSSSGIFGMFRYADATDILLMFIGTLASAVNGSSLPLLAIIFGQMTNMFSIVATYGFKPENVTSDLMGLQMNSSEIESNATITRSEFTMAMEQFSVYYLYVSASVFVSVFIQALCWESACERQVFRLRQVFFAQILRQDISWYDDNEDGDLPHKLSDDLERIREGIGSKFSMLTQYCSTFIIGLIVGFHANADLTLALLAVAPVVIGLSAVVARALSSSSEREQIRYGIAGGICSEVLNGIKTVSSFGGESREIQRYAKALEEGSKLAMGKYHIFSIAAGVMYLSTYGAFGFAFWYGASLVNDEDVSAGSIFTVFFSVMTGAFSIGSALPFINSVATAVGAASSILGIIDRQPAIDCYSHEGKILDHVEGVIEFRDVEFRYPSRPETKVLRGLNIKIEPGKSVALVGASGAGKSTAVGLLMRFYDPERGQVLLDGTPLKDLSLPWLRSQIGVVSQEPVLFGVTIAENIRYGRTNVTKEEIVEAATKANAHSFIKNLPKGYDTEVGDKGSALSGGQKQRIAIARALVRNPKILLLDEATSALDNQSERVVQAALDNAMAGRTTITIAHRLSTIKNVDIIYALKDGMVAESGSHEQLMASNGLYYSLVIAQQKQEKEGQLMTGYGEEDDPSLGYNYQGRRRSSGVLTRNSMRCSNRSTASTNFYIGGSNEFDHDLKESVNRVSFLKILKLNLEQWPCMLLMVIGSVVVGISMPLFSSLYADVFNTFTLRGEEFKIEVRFWTIVYTCFAVFTGTGNYIASICSCIITEKIVASIRVKTFTNIVKQSIGWFDHKDHSPGRLVTCLARDPPLVKSAAGYRASQVLIAITALCSAVTIAFSTGWKLASVLMLIVPIIAAAAYKQASLLVRHQKRDSQLMDSAGQVATEAVLNLKTVQALGKEQLFLERYKQFLVQPYKESRKQAYYYAIIFAITQSVLYVMYATAFFFGAKLIEKDEMTPTSVYRVFFALSFCTTALGQASTYFQEFSRAKISISFVYRLMTLDSEVDSLSNEGLTPTIKGAVTFRNVHFSYPTRPNVPILRGLDLNIQPGETVALVGGSGCGKSTLIGLLERFYLPTGGKVMIDGTDVSQMKVSWLRSQIGLVTQEPILFDRSIRENIAYGSPVPEFVTDDQIFSAAKTANIHEFIVNLPQGYDTPAGDRGAKLSGGQKQRIAIARAIVRNPKILLLDEATSALDSESEKIVQDALDSARLGRTCIIVAHRLSTVQNADVIAVIDRGRIAEKGTHEQLVDLRGIYYNLVKDQ
ncbi:Multidrug resistance protein [Nesidiocoris tenuis]|uniref:Multidrug resistance protein n=2 Tax=Nesidiocoris tenuis TaxID=355587 RepID=A0ABN7AXV0_9HEMI|nr:Multidrug resistance protein [Nesidiocoris tenuis]